MVPARNAAGTIERAVRSAIADATPSAPFEVEVLVVDDGSPDGTAGVVERLAAVDPRIRLLRSAGSEGPSGARNVALAAARGGWLTFLDADDRLLSGGLAAMVAAASRPGVHVVVGQRVWTDGWIRWRAASYDVPDVRRAGRASLVGRPGLVRYASLTGKLFERSLADGLRLEGRVLGDQPWTIRALLRAGDSIEVVATDVYEWSRPRRGAMTSSITASKRGSARLAADAARVAVGAFADVTVEAEAQLSSPTDRVRVLSAYMERLIRQDLGGPVRRAVSGRDPGTVELLEAVGAFLASVPSSGLVLAPDVLDAIARDLLRPPLEGWARLDGPGRRAVLALLRTTADRWPAVVPLLTRGTLLGPGVAGLLRPGVDSNAPEIGRLLARQRPLALATAAGRFVRLGLSRLRTTRPAAS